MFLLALSLLMPANAGSLDLIAVGGNWGTPGATNPTALWWNPAGVAAGEGTQFLIEGAPVLATVDFDRTNPDYGPPMDVDGDDEPDPYDYSGKEQIKFNGVVPFVGVTSDFGVEGLGFGVALAVPFARGGRVGDAPPTFEELSKGTAGAGDYQSSPGSFHLRDGNIQAIYAILGGGYEINDMLALGVSGAFVDSTWYAVTDVESLSLLQDNAGGLVTYADQLFEDPNYRSTLTFDNLKDQTFTFGLGAQFKPIDEVTIAVSYNHGLNLSHTGDVMVVTGCPPESDTLGRFGVEQLGLCNANTKGTSTVGYKLPSRVNAGVVVRPVDAVRLEAMGGFVGWSAFSDYDIQTRVTPEAVDDAADPEITADLISQDRKWARDNRDTFWVGLDGKGEVIDDTLTVGARVLYDRSAIPDEVLSTNNFDANSVNVGGLVAVGPFAGLSFSASLEQQFLADRTVKKSAFQMTLPEEDRKPVRYYYPPAEGQYSAGITRIGISVMGAFGKKTDTVEAQ